MTSAMCSAGNLRPAVRCAVHDTLCASPRPAGSLLQLQCICSFTACLAGADDCEIWALLAVSLALYLAHNSQDEPTAAAAQVFKEMQHPDQEVMNLWEPQVKLDEACQWRCAT